MLAAVGGIMAFLSFHELLPLAMEHAGRHAAIAALFAGMALMALNLFILDHWLGGEH
jgi:ZIP family zinc transporter